MALDTCPPIVVSPVLAQDRQMFLCVMCRMPGEELWAQLLAKGNVCLGEQGAESVFGIKWSMEISLYSF